MLENCLVFYFFQYRLPRSFFGKKFLKISSAERWKETIRLSTKKPDNSVDREETRYFGRELRIQTTNVSRVIWFLRARPSCLVS